MAQPSKEADLQSKITIAFLNNLNSTSLNDSIALYTCVVKILLVKNKKIGKATLIETNNNFPQIFKNNMDFLREIDYSLILGSKQKITLFIPLACLLIDYNNRKEEKKIAADVLDSCINNLFIFNKGKLWQENNSYYLRPIFITMDKTTSP